MDFNLFLQIFLLIFGCIAVIKLFLFIKIPNPALLGSIVFFTVLKLNNLLPTLPIFWIMTLGQLILSINIASKFTRETFHYFRKIILPLLTSTISTFIIAIASGLLFYLYYAKDLTSVLIANAPGGFAEMLAFGLSLNADATLITFIQVTRLIMILAGVPFILKLLNCDNSETEVVESIKSDKKETLPKHELIPIIIINSLLCYLFFMIEVPAAIIIASLLGSCSYLIWRNKSFSFSRRTLYFSHACIGLASASKFTYESLIAFSEYFLPITIIAFMTISLSLIQGYILSIFTKWDKATCYLASVNGGLSVMVVLAQEMKANVPIVVFFHLIRLVSVIILWPIFITVLVNYNII